MTRPRGLTLIDYMRELTEPHPHREHYTTRTAGAWVGHDHVVRVPALITQLWQNDTPSATAEEGPRPGFQSKPAARLDAIDTVVRIDIQAARWIRDLGEDDDSLDTIATVRQLHGLVRSADPVQRKAIEHDVRSWWLQARIVTGWDSPAWCPSNTCPQCGQRGTLKIRLGEHIGMCTNDACRATWDQATIGLLADHIRAECEAEKAPAIGAEPCWCPWPLPSIPDMTWQCPRCGSARCTHALRRRLLAAVRRPQSVGA